MVEYFEASVDEFVKAAENLTSDGLRNLDVSKYKKIAYVKYSLIVIRNMVVTHLKCFSCQAGK